MPHAFNIINNIVFFLISCFITNISFKQTPTIHQNISIPIALWASGYNGPNDTIDILQSMTGDSTGNIYVTGYSQVEGTFQYNCTTIKYNTKGTQQWVGTYDGPGYDWGNGVWSYTDICNDIAVDDDGYVYVTGYSYSSQNIDYITIRYTPGGILDWEQRYTNHDANTVDKAYHLLVDDNYVYVTGIIDEGNNPGILTITYDHSGNFVRERLHEGTIPHDFTIDEDGNLYIFAEPKFRIIKYAANGDKLWSADYDTGGKSATPSAMAVDTAGNVFITGKIESQGIVTVKYDENGIYKWMKQYYILHTAEASDIAVDNEGNIIITGYAWVSPSTENDIVTIKYDTNGNVIWQQIFDASVRDTVTQLVVDQNNNIYIMGQSWGWEYHVIKYNDNGELIFRYHHSEEMADLSPNKIALDYQGNIIIGGLYQNDYIVIKYPPVPPVVLSVEDTITSEDNSPGEVKIRVSRPDYVYYPISFSYSTKDGSAIAGSDYVTSTGQKTMMSGEFQKFITIPLINNEIDEETETFSVTLDNITNATLIKREIHITVYDGDKNRISWIRRFNGAEDDNPEGLAIDDADNIYVVANINEFSNYLMALVKYDTNGNQLWSRNYPAFAKSLIIDNKGNPVVVGRDGYLNCLVIKYNPDGTEAWVNSYENHKKSYDFCNSVRTDSLNNIVAVGNAQTYSNFEQRPIFDYLTLKYNENGVLLWSRINGALLTEDDVAQKVIVDKQKNIYVAGYSTNSVSKPITVLKYNPDGILLWKTDINPNANNNVVEMSMGNNGIINISTNERAFRINQQGELIYSLFYETDEVYSAAFTDNQGFANTGFNNTSKYLWRNWNQKQWDYEGHGEDIISDQHNNFYVSGIIYRDTTGADFLTTAFDNNGNVLWRQATQGQGDYWEYEIGEFISMDSKGSLVVTGESQKDFQTIKYSPIILPPLLSVKDAFVFRSDATPKMSFTVNLTRASTQEITFDYSTIDWSAKSGEDFTGVSGKAVIPPNTTTYTIEVPIKYEISPAENRILYLDIINLENAFYQDSLGIGTIFGVYTTHYFFPLLLR
ncbi:MAG: SBBP repeat-containing protein [Anaerolineales bacterium]|nr:SBBP repeat-containing protein [Anaerolineales bacterium]